MSGSALAGIDGTSVRYLLQASGDVPADDAWLAPVERVRLAQLRVAKRRADWRLGRWTAKRAVAAALGVAVDRVAVIAAAGGAPLALLDGVPARSRSPQPRRRAGAVRRGAGGGGRRLATSRSWRRATGPSPRTTSPPPNRRWRAPTRAW
ncbi:MAG: hypothetical protein U0802_11705 [Candidatus Binatia bacterium]